MSLSQGDPAPDRGPNTPNEWGVVIIVSFFFFLLLLLELARDFSVYKLSVPFFILSWIVLLAIHELGHAVVARLLGWDVAKVCIGSGKVRAEFRWRGTIFQFRTIPLSGFVSPRPRDLIAPRLKEFLIFSAGPGVELLLVVVAVFLFGADSILERQPLAGLIAVQSFCAAALFGALMNLLPLPHRTEGGMAWSDGLGMILCWTIPDATFREWMKNDPDEASHG